MTESAAPSVEDRIAELAELLGEQVEPLSEEMDRAVFAASPSLAADPGLAAETAASNRANMRRWITAITAHPERDVGGDPPPEALDIATSLSRRGMDVSPLFAAYRAGQNVAWRAWMEIAAQRISDRGELIAVLERSSALMNAYVDLVLDAVLEHSQRERDEMLGGAPARRAETIRLILDGAPIDIEVAASRLGYELRRKQTALVLWHRESALDVGTLERAAQALAQAAGAGLRPLTLSAGAAVLWAWIGGPIDEQGMREAVAGIDERVLIAIGPTRPGMAGFRRSHRSAIDAQRILAGAVGSAQGPGERVVHWEDVQAVALAGQDPEAAREFTASVLGRLDGGDTTTAELRETVRVYLEAGSSGPRAAERLHLHRNTVLHRLGRAEELLGYPVGERRLALMLALELARFGR